MVPAMPLAEIELTGPARTTRAGEVLAPFLRPGDAILLEGPLGSGKTHLARAVVRALAGRDVEVPSPTFTLVQTYDVPAGIVWHADLYRIEDPSEIAETGLEDALEDAICLIEWPERLGWTPAEALHVTLSHRGDAARGMTLAGGNRWIEAVDAARTAIADG